MEPELRIKGRNLPEIAGSSTTSTFTAVWDTWWENISGGSTGLCASNTTVWNKWDSCRLLNLQRWQVYAIVDWEQNRRAIADPYGWRNQEP